ncbi:MAG: RNA polymerase sigma factor [Myxococcaceae bacterium]
MAASDRDGPEAAPAIKEEVQSVAPLTPVPAGPDEAAFAAAYDAEFEAVWLYLRRLGVPEADVEDAVHDVFVVAHRRYGAYDPSRPLRPWLLGIAFRVAAQWRRRHRLEVTVADPEPERPDDARAPDELVASQQVRSRLQAALSQLDIHQRAVVVMHDLNGVPVPEIASALDVPLNTVYSRLRLGRAKITAALRGEP